MSESDIAISVRGVNPLSPLLEAFRWSLLGTGRPAPLALALAFATAVSAGVLVVGAFSFKKMERKFADVI